MERNKDYVQHKEKKLENLKYIKILILEKKTNSTKLMESSSSHLELTKKLKIAERKKLRII